MDEIERIQRRISLHDLRVLMWVIQAGSMGKAAKRLATSQPAVSRSIADLESVLGVRLVDRSPQGIEPTQYGRALLRRGISVFDELGQGIKTALLQVAAEQLDVPMASLKLITADTSITPNEGFTAGSRSMQDSGSAILHAAAQARAAS